MDQRSLHFTRTLIVEMAVTLSLFQCLHCPSPSGILPSLIKLGLRAHLWQFLRYSLKSLLLNEA